MLVNITLTRSKNGGIQIYAANSNLNPMPVMNYDSIDQVRGVLGAFGYPEQVIDKQMELLAEFGPEESLPLPAIEVPEETLWEHGFRL